MKISFVIPCYRSEQTIEAVVEEIHAAMEPAHNEHEIILVNDSSPDDVWQVIERMASEQPNLLGINLLRNFGQHAALMAGFAHVTGDIVVCGDDDGQTPYDEVFKLINVLDENYDCVSARYDGGKKHNLFRNFGSNVNDLMSRILLGKPKGLRINSFFVTKRIVIDEILRYKHSFPFLGGLLLRTTRRIINVPVTHRERQDGTSGYTLFKLLGLWMNGFTAFSVKPLRLASILGVIVALVGFGFGTWVLINKITNPLAPVGWTSIMSALLFLGGVIMLILGLIGEYIGRIYICMNDAPQYIVKDVVSSAHK